MQTQPSMIKTFSLITQLDSYLGSRQDRLES